MRKAILKKTAAIVMAGAMITGMAGCGASGPKSSDQEVSGRSGSKVYKVGIVQYVDDASLNQIEKSIEARLDELDREEGVTFDYEDYTYNGQADGTVLNQIASELVEDQVDLIIPIATPTAQIMQAATEKSGIPVVFAAASDPVGAKLVASMDKPGSNVTGTSDALNTEAVINLITAQLPDADYVGLLYSKSEDSSKLPIEDAKKLLDARGIRYIEKTGTTNDEVAAATDALAAEGVDAIFTPTDNTVMTAELGIYEKMAKAGIPHFAGADSFALNGAFCGYGVDYRELGRKTADMAAQVLVEGKNTAELPVQTFDSGIAMVNEEICRELGFEMEKVREAFQPFCNEVITTKIAKEFE